MRIGRNEIIEELTEHIRQCGGEPGDWCVGTGSTIQEARFKMQDETEAGTLKLDHREALTPYTAADAVEYLVSAFGLRPDPGATPGKFVFIYRGIREAVGAKR